MIHRTLATRAAVVFVAASLGLGGSLVAAAAHANEDAGTANAAATIDPTLAAQIADYQAQIQALKADLAVVEAALDRMDERDDEGSPAATAEELALMDKAEQLEAQIAALEAKIEAAEKAAEAAQEAAEAAKEAAEKAAEKAAETPEVEAPREVEKADTETGDNEKEDSQAHGANKHNAQHPGEQHQAERSDD